MRQERVDELLDFYRSALLDDLLPFWTRHGIDREAGGYLGCLDRDGRVYGTRKSIVQQARMLWLFARLHNTLESKGEWLELAQHGLDFLLAHGFDASGRPLHTVDRAGRARRRTRSPNGLAFVIQGLSEMWIATGDAALRQRALALHERWLRETRHLETRLLPRLGVRSLPTRMLQILLTPALRRLDERPAHEALLERSVREIFEDFWWEEAGVLLERLSRKGRPIGRPQERLICPGHGIEVAWFLLDEASSRGNEGLGQRALPLVMRSLENGWDAEHGGLFLRTDPLGQPFGSEDARKIWWPHAEALCASLLAHVVGGDAESEAWFERIHAYVWAHFPDPEHGDWFAYLDREGRPLPGVATGAGRERPRDGAKGDLKKSAYHLGRCLRTCWLLLESLRSGEPAPPLR